MSKGFALHLIHITLFVKVLPGDGARKIISVQQEKWKKLKE